MNRYESIALVPASSDEIFAHLDDFARLSSHMDRGSWMMAGGRMKFDFDAAHGQQVGSRIRLAGRVLGIPLSLEETVTERVPPSRKVWETNGEPRLVVIGGYRMGFELLPRPGGTQLRVFIQYALPSRAPFRWLGRIFGRYYAKWCTQQMVDDAVRAFAPSGPSGSIGHRAVKVAGGH
jgi:hypothetical protein